MSEGFTIANFRSVATASRRASLRFWRALADGRTVRMDRKAHSIFAAVACFDLILSTNARGGSCSRTRPNDHATGGHTNV
jgi:hypothetical protein